MDIETLKIFKELAHGLNMSQTAKKLNYVQSNVTTRIKKLEKKFETELFYRHARGVTLSENGRLLLPYIERLLVEWENAENSLNKKEQFEYLTVGAIDSISATDLPEILHKFSEEYSNVELDIHIGNTGQLIDQVLNGECSCAFVAGPVNHDHLISEFYSEELLELLVHSSQVEKLKKEGLNGATILVLGEGCAYRNHFLFMLKNEGITPKKVMTFTNLEALYGCIQAGVGIALLSEKYSNVSRHANISRLSVDYKYQKLNTLFIYRSVDYDRNVIKNFRTYLER